MRAAPQAASPQPASMAITPPLAPLTAPTKMRVPLYPAELALPPADVVVTGAAGFVASAIVKRLLAAGHRVRGTVRDPTNAARVRHLTALPGAAERLTLHAADALEAGCFDEVARGAQFFIHAASPVIMTPARGREQELLVDPAVRGAEHAVAAVAAAPSVKALVLTSSYFAVFADNVGAKGAEHVYTEADWNTSSTLEGLPYALSKAAAERRAWELHGAQAGPRRWRMAAINPGFVAGPPEQANAASETVALMRLLLGGLSYTFPLGWPWADVDDVAAAHCLAMALPAATGRFLVASEGAVQGELIRRAQAEHPAEMGGMRVPRGAMPWALGWLAAKAGAIPMALLRGTWNSVPRFDASRAERELGLRYTPATRTVADTAARFRELGEIK